jgi:hypothetical protein
MPDSGFCAKAASHLQWPDRPGLAPGSLFSCSFSRNPAWITENYLVLTFLTQFLLVVKKKFTLIFSFNY